MKVLPRLGQNGLFGQMPPSISPEPSLAQSPNDNFIATGLFIPCSQEQRTALLHSIISPPADPGVSLATNKFRGGPDLASKEAFRQSLLDQLRQGWENAARTEARFMKLVDLVQRDGCAVFAGLIDTTAFQHLIDDFSDLMTGVGTKAFLHSFANLIQHPGFVKNEAYNDAIIHPLLIAIMSYVMGGPVRMTDARGKDTEPISVNAQDNMLHIDNTPFREEYKILLGWEKGKVKGPTGQNFTFLPGTQKGNRSIRQSGSQDPSLSSSIPWSTENDSLFITDPSIDGVFQFQQDITGVNSPKVIEVEYPEQPVTILFSAGSLVHHRYRNKAGNPRSCVIAAFHLVSDNPGELVRSETPSSSPNSIAGLLMGYQSDTPTNRAAFISTLAAHSSRIESKITELLTPSHPSTLVDTTNLSLTGDRLARWRETVVHAPSATKVKFENSHFLSSATSGPVARSALVDRLAAAMSYDKHGLLDLIIYADGHEEARKPARKAIYTMPREKLAEVVGAWVYMALSGHQFSLDDVERPAVLRERADRAAAKLTLLRTANGAGSEKTTEEEVKRDEGITSLHQVIVDLGESITRCEKFETYITTNLFLFLAVNQVVRLFDDWVVREELVKGCGVPFLRAYIACVLVVEREQGI